MPLTGSEPLAKGQELGVASTPDLVRAAGQLTSRNDGSERLNFTAFVEALHETEPQASAEAKPSQRNAVGREPGGRRALASRSTKSLAGHQETADVVGPLGQRQ